jgi:hypothetical protein
MTWRIIVGDMTSPMPPGGAPQGVSWTVLEEAAPPHLLGLRFYDASTVAVQAKRSLISCDSINCVPDVVKDLTTRVIFHRTMNQGEQRFLWSRWPHVFAPPGINASENVEWWCFDCRGHAAVVQPLG